MIEVVRVLICESKSSYCLSVHGDWNNVSGSESHSWAGVFRFTALTRSLQISRVQVIKYECLTRLISFPSFDFVSYA